MQYRRHDFLRNVYAAGTVGEEFSISADEPLFYARLTRPTKRVVRKMLVIGNSITQHGPAPDIGWTNSCGMAASGTDKDYVHLLHAALCRHQPKPEPELVVRSMSAVKLPERLSQLRALAGVGADLVVIQMGDNLQPDQANHETLRKPYELLIKSLRRADPEALLVVVSTWGGGANRDEMMALACRNQYVPFVRIDHLIRDERNRAVSEERFEHSGVNWHPGDRGMKAIADLLWEHLKPNIQPRRA